MTSMLTAFREEKYYYVYPLVKMVQASVVEDCQP